MEHKEALPKLDKHQREMLHKLNPSELLTLIEEPLKSKAGSFSKSISSRSCMKWLSLDSKKKRRCLQ